MIIDSHAHVWSDDSHRYPWQPTFGYVPNVPASPDVLLETMDTRGVERAVLVQPSVYGDDHRFTLDTVAAHPDRFVAIGQVDPAEPLSAEHANRLVHESGVVGLRVIFALEPARAQLQASSPTWDELTCTRVPISLRAMPIHHQHVLGLLRRYPRTQFVLDHLGLPHLDDQPSAARRIGELAQFGNCHVKLAGLARLRANSGQVRRLSSVRPLVRAFFEHFGPTRMAWGSDFPGVDERAVLGTALTEIDAMTFLDGPARAEVLGRTTARLWGLQ